MLVGRCLSYGEGITYWPLAEIVRQVGDLSTAAQDELVVKRIDAALEGGEATADEIARAFRKLFESLAQKGPPNRRPRRHRLVGADPARP